MFKHFIGKIYLLDKPPLEETTQLDIPFPESILGDLDEEKYSIDLTKEQVAKIIAYKTEMSELLGKDEFNQILKSNAFQTSDSDFLLAIAREMKHNPENWNGLAYLNSDNAEDWHYLLFKIINLKRGSWEALHGTFVEFIKILSLNWKLSIPELLTMLEEYEIDIDKFFKLERTVTFKFASLLSDVNELQKHILKKGVDVSPFISKTSHAFLPSVVYQMEEYGLPRMISRKLHKNKIINFNDDNLTIHKAISEFQRLGKNNILRMQCFDGFDKYILEYFFDGITIEKTYSDINSDNILN